MIQLIVVLIVVGVLLWALNTYVPMQPPFKAIVNVAVILMLCLYILNLFHIVSLPLPR